MKVENIKTGENHVSLHGKIWMSDEKPGMVLQISHGMTEHIGRYEKLAEALTEQGIAVAGFDLRGHGCNGGNPACASFGEGGWDASIRDMHLFYQEIENRFPNIPHFMMGFSLGSFLLRDYLSIYHDNIAGAVIMGTGDQPGFILTILMQIIKKEIKSHGFDSSTPLVDKMSFENYNQKFAPNTTPYDWLCADEKQLAAYSEDALCRKHISAGLFYQLLDAMRRTGKKSTYEKWDKTIPILLLSGQNDPVGDFGKGVRRGKKGMDQAGLKKVEVHLLPNARHDLLHEEKSGASKQAIDILLKWMDEKRS
ncbi:MAG: alpha/beta fold hydrolase [Schaedlerella sp.]|nr:alpha/beta hydrolase [Lachnospiraceae bacterium]MDY4202555.1 alpha/beta fold hydrolase [Schaedlerella sp.]